MVKTHPNDPRTMRSTDASGLDFLQVKQSTYIMGLGADADYEHLWGMSNLDPFHYHDKNIPHDWPPFACIQDMACSFGD